mmetsp:Transcript_91282/g.254939  ORF Transcript_91282/g.254939 Transcript_91282/m.254939 type:complete len:207 (+) Transcript_91282:131-751(+)
MRPRSSKHRTGPPERPSASRALVARMRDAPGRISGPVPCLHRGGRCSYTEHGRAPATPTARCGRAAPPGGRVDNATRSTSTSKIYAGQVAVCRRRVWPTRCLRLGERWRSTSNARPRRGSAMAAQSGSDGSKPARSASSTRRSFSPPIRTRPPLPARSPVAPFPPLPPAARRSLRTKTRRRPPRAPRRAAPAPRRCSGGSTHSRMR